MPCVWVVTFGSLVDRTYSVPEYHAAYHAQSEYPTVAPGQTAEWVIALTNTGTTGWDLGQTTTWVGPGQQMALSGSRTSGRTWT